MNKPTVKNELFGLLKLKDTGPVSKYRSPIEVPYIWFLIMFKLLKIVSQKSKYAWWITGGNSLKASYAEVELATWYYI